MAWTGSVWKCSQTHLVSSRNVIFRRSRLDTSVQQRCGFRRDAKTPKTRQAQEAGSQKPPPKMARPSLFKPLLFTVGFTGCSFGTAAVLQYETLRSRVQKRKEEEESDELLQGSRDLVYWHDWWNELNNVQQQPFVVMSAKDEFWKYFSEGQQTVTGIIAANVIVLCCWRVPSLQRRMFKYFTANPASKIQCLPMFLSTFSHYSTLHMMCNMYVLWTFSSTVVSLFGREQFLAMYTSAGVISSMVSYMCKSATLRFRPTLGASAAIIAVLAAAWTKVPEATLPMVTFTAENALKAIIAMDTAGLLMGWQLLDHAANLGGALFGIWYVYYGHNLIWRRREPLVKFWHNMRSSGSGRSGPAGRPVNRPGPQ